MLVPSGALRLFSSGVCRRPEAAGQIRLWG
jgi:hypothetical protein